MKNILTCLLLFCTIAARSQQLIRISLANNSNVEQLTIELEKGLLLNVSKEGTIIDFGVDTYYGPGEQYWQKLQPYAGRIEQYAAGENEAYRGKIKYIGKTHITYYASFEHALLQGKIKSIGNILFDYYSTYDDAAIRGFIKNLGSLKLDWYTSFDNEALKGKLRAAGNTLLTYYTSFDDKAYRGRVRSIGSTQFTYYSSMDRREYQGGMKSGNSLVYANNLRFIVRN